MKVEEIMSRDVKSVSPETNVREAFSLLQKMKISGLPVIDENKKLVGMFTEKDILSYLLPSYIDRVGRFVYEENPKSTKSKLQDLAKVPISKLMRKEVLTINEDTALCEVARLMLTQKIRRLPILDKEKRVVGIIAREDIVKAYAREAGWEID